MDTPLLYETGWGKKLTYVIAFSAAEAIDVIARYTNHYTDVLQHRTLVSEAWLIAELGRINQALRAKVRIRARGGLSHGGRLDRHGRAHRRPSSYSGPSYCLDRCGLDRTNPGRPERAVAAPVGRGARAHRLQDAPPRRAPRGNWRPRLRCVPLHPSKHAWNECAQLCSNARGPARRVCGVAGCPPRARRRGGGGAETDGRPVADRRRYSHAHSHSFWCSPPDSSIPLLVLPMDADMWPRWAVDTSSLRLDRAAALDPRPDGLWVTLTPARNVRRSSSSSPSSAPAAASPRD